MKQELKIGDKIKRKGKVYIIVVDYGGQGGDRYSAISDEFVIVTRWYEDICEVVDCIESF